MNQQHGSVKTRATNARAAYGHQAQVAINDEPKIENMTTMQRFQKALTPPAQITQNPWKAVGLTTVAGLVVGYVLGLTAFVSNDEVAEELA